jgi:hypothetical protein
MKRRQLLLTMLPAVFGAGCSSGYEGPTSAEREPSPSPSPSSTPIPTPTPRPTPSGYFRRVSIVEQFSPADDRQVDLTAELTEPWITSEHTATMDVTLTNRGPDTRTFYDFDEVELRRGLFNSGGALLGPVEYPPECIGTDGLKSGPFGHNAAVWAEDLAPGESVTLTFGIVDDPRTRGCISPGTYRYDWRKLSFKRDSRDSDAEYYPSLRWGVKVEIEAPNE